MSEVISMFSHPVLVIDDYQGIEAIADEYREKSMGLMAEFPNAGLISNAWHHNQRAQSKEDFEKHGFTSYHSVDLATRQDFQFINNIAMEVVAQYLRVVGKPNLGIRMSNAWASIYGRGHFVPQHTHPMAHISLVFYAAATQGTGQLVFDNPARGHFQHFYTPEISWLHYRFSIPPKKGMFVVFPSYMAHNTEPHESDDYRVIYSANLQLQFNNTNDTQKVG